MEYKGIEESLKYLVSEIGNIEKELIEIRTKIDLKTYSLRDIAEGLGCSLYTLRSHPWKIPNYGRPDACISPAKWFYDTVRDWYSVPEDERRFKWESMTSRERREIKVTNKASPDRATGFHILEDGSTAKAG